MSRCPTTKWIPISEAKASKIYRGYKTIDQPNGTTFCEFTYLGEGKGYSFNYKDNIISNVSEVLTYTTFEEQKQWYIDHTDLNNAETVNNLYGLFHDLYDVGDASHQMWNYWIADDAYELLCNLEEEDFFLVGIAPASYAFAGKEFEDSIAFVIETYDTGTRYWCHGYKSWVKDMRAQMEHIYKEKINEM